jgi:hypothetical protein
MEGPMNTTPPDEASPERSFGSKEARNFLADLQRRIYETGLYDGSLPQTLRDSPEVQASQLRKAEQAALHLTEDWAGFQGGLFKSLQFDSGSRVIPNRHQ